MLKYLITVQRFPDWNAISSSNTVWAYCRGKIPQTTLFPLGKNKCTKFRMATHISFGGAALCAGGNLIAWSLRWSLAGLPGIRKPKLSCLCLLTWHPYYLLMVPGLENYICLKLLLGATVWLFSTLWIEGYRGKDLTLSTLRFWRVTFLRSKTQETLNGHTAVPPWCKSHWSFKKPEAHVIM